MTTKPPSPEKLHKAAVILECTQAIAAHCKVEAEHIISPIPRKKHFLQDARALLVYHLYSCGMSFDAIARMLGRSVDHIRRLESTGAIRMMSRDRELIDSLPRIPSTLKTSPAEQ